MELDDKAGQRAETASRLLASHHDIPDEYSTQEGVCCFCGVDGDGQHVDDATSKKYFSDDPLLRVPSSDHVCKQCGWVMAQRTYKQGHWVAHDVDTETPSTGDLLGLFRRLRAGDYDPPLAIHVTSSPIRSSHSYLWTPVNISTNPLTVAYDREKVRIEDWQTFANLVAAIEDLRLHRFTFDEIKSGEPRVQNVESIGLPAYRDRAQVIEPYRRTARLELALTLSRSDDDQPRTDLTDDHDPLIND